MRSWQVAYRRILRIDLGESEHPVAAVEFGWRRPGVECAVPMAMRCPRSGTGRRPARMDAVYVYGVVAYGRVQHDAWLPTGASMAGAPQQQRNVLSEACFDALTVATCWHRRGAFVSGDRGSAFRHLGIHS